MLRYIDIIIDKIVLTDSVPIEDLDGVILKAQGKWIWEDLGVSDSSIRGNKWAENEDDADENKVRVIDIVDKYQLAESHCVVSKKDYKEYVKPYLHEIRKHMTDQNADEILKKAQDFVNSVYSDFESYRLFTLDPYNEAGSMIIPCKEENGIPFLYYFKHGLKTEEA